MLYKTKNPHGGDIYSEKVLLDFSVNTNPFGSPRGVKDAVCGMIHKMDSYPDPYCRELVKKISESENIPDDYILCGNGASELIYSYFEALMPRRVLETAPSFLEYSAVFENTGCSVLRYSLSEKNSFELGEGILDFLENEKPDVFVICNPNNPTGRLVKPDLMEKILFACEKNNARLFVDECFLDLTEKGISMKAYLERFPNLFILKAFTKSYGMAGLRLGYCMCSDEELLKKMSKRVQPWNVSIFAQKAGAAALEESGFLEKSRKYISAERKYLAESLVNLGFSVIPSDANYLLFCGEKDLDIKLKEQGVLIRNCSNYYGLGEGWYRIAVRIHEENEELIKRLKSICEKR
ncbi:MAG: aminotransferase class I/II-fold pyridoxal phosphate-dependent enzyme [Firmicutes bacterium]|nr:aminotransferase class I/II-fold pyridoxal phosphate-dependent enzyme [Bacillota bacterium]